MKKSESSQAKLDRNTVERNRRIHMKALCFKLTSLIPPHHFKPSKEFLSQKDQLDQAATYIKQLRERIEELKAKKEMELNMNGSSFVELKDLGSTLEVVLVTELKKNFVMYEIISILEEEGAEVVSASYFTVGDKNFHTIHAQAKVSRVGVDTSKVSQRLQELIC